MSSDVKNILHDDWFMVMMLILFCPIGIFLMWKNRRYSKPVRWIISISLGVSYYIILKNING